MVTSVARLLLRMGRRSSRGLTLAVLTRVVSVVVPLAALLRLRDRGYCYRLPVGRFEILAPLRSRRERGPKTKGLGSPRTGYRSTERRSRARRVPVAETPSVGAVAKIDGRRPAAPRKERTRGRPREVRPVAGTSTGLGPPKFGTNAARPLSSTLAPCRGAVPARPSASLPSGRSRNV